MGHSKTAVNTKPAIDGNVLMAVVISGYKLIKSIAEKTTDHSGPVPRDHEKRERAWRNVCVRAQRGAMMIYEAAMFIPTKNRRHLLFITSVPQPASEKKSRG